MKKISFLIVVAFSALTFYACEGFFTNVTTSEGVSIDEVFKTGEDLEAALRGAYDIVREGELMGCYTVAFSDILSGNANGWDLELSNLDMQSSNLF
ncbi:MAG: hypothetical protein DWQ02_22505, partial [Bacteroidetes bacterium]